MLENLWNHVIWPQHRFTYLRFWGPVCYQFLTCPSKASILLPSTKILNPYHSLHSPKSSSSPHQFNFSLLIATNYSMVPRHPDHPHSNIGGLIIPLKDNPSNCALWNTPSYLLRGPCFTVAWFSIKILCFTGSFFFSIKHSGQHTLLL